MMQSKKYKAVTHGVEVSMSATYSPDASDARERHFVWDYRMTVENTNSFPIRILLRTFSIFRSPDTELETTTEMLQGVPYHRTKIPAGGKFDIVSAMVFENEMIRLKGWFTVQNDAYLDTFKVRIPRYEMICPDKLN